MLLVEFPTSANLTGFHVFDLCTYSHGHSILHTGGDAFSKKIERSLNIFFDNFVEYSCRCHVLPAEAPRRIWQCVKWIKWGWLAYTTPTVRDICTFAVLCLVIKPFLSLYFMLCNKEEFQKELSRKIVLCQICIGLGLRRSAVIFMSPRRVWHLCNLPCVYELLSLISLARYAFKI